MATEREIQDAFDNAHLYKLNKWTNGTQTTDKNAFDNYVKNKVVNAYTKDEANNMFAPKGTAPSGGGSVSNIKIDTINSPIKSIEGKYSVNLFDYNELAEFYPKIGITGIRSASDKHQRGIHTIGKESSPKFPHEYIGHPLGISGIKKDKDIIIDFHWYLKPEDYSHGRHNEGKLEIDVIETGLSVTGSKFEIGSNETGSKKIRPSKYGFYKLGFGSKTYEKPDKYGLHVQAYYGDFKPNGIKRDFQFLKYNNIELLSNGTDKDIYKIGTLTDTITKKLNCVNIRDLKIHRGNPSHEVFGHLHYIAIELPDDCDIPESQREEEEGKLLGLKCITNNLPDITYEDESKHPHEDRPHFVQYISQILVENTEHNLVSKWCWVILIDLDKIDHWEKLLYNTQIIYPIEEKLQTETPIPFGGQLYTLTNNRTFRTCLYKSVSEDTTTGTVTFKGEPNYGTHDVTIQKSEIVSIEQI